MLNTVDLSEIDNATETEPSREQILRMLWRRGLVKSSALDRHKANVAYIGARRRCTNVASSQWKNYGARGIKFLFTSFEQFYDEIGPPPTPQHSIDRKDNDGNYEPGNVRWATDEEQSANKRRTVA